MRDHGKGGALTEVTFYILLSLYLPRHGYAIMQFIEEQTGGRLVLGAGTLYGALAALEKKAGLLYAAAQAEKRIRYHRSWQEVAKQELKRLRELERTAADIMSPDKKRL